MGTAHPPRMNANDPEERAADAHCESEPCVARTCPNPRKCLGGNHSYSSDPWHHRRPAIVLPLPPCPARAIKCSVPVPVPITITTITRRPNDIFYRHLPLSSHLMTLFFLYLQRHPMPAFRLGPQARASSTSHMSPLATQCGW